MANFSIDKQKLIDLLDANGLYDSINKQAKNTQKEFPNGPVGKFAPIYSYISKLIKGHVDPLTDYWFQMAPSINSDDVSKAADAYVRGVTQYGLEFRKNLVGLSQDQINLGLQRTSNVIGENVINQILANNGEIPSFSDMISNDVSAAIGPNNLATFLSNPAAFQQDIGGWGGSFYYWGVLLNGPSGQSTQVKAFTRHFPKIANKTLDI